MGITQFLSSLFGTKSDRDIKENMPVVDAIKKEYERITNLSNNELRAESLSLKKEINDYVKAEEDEIADLKEKAENADLEESEKIYDRIDNLTETIDEKIEEVLKKVLPQAFAIVKETAKRFKENDTVTVKANDFDREMAAVYDHVSIEGDNAIWSNTWMAGGNKITWDMVHYDVQLIGGIVLHEGKIAEMATGEGKTLVATLPVFLNALTGKGVHLVTVNDYLARRDSEWMGPIYQFHGLSVDCIDKHKPNSEERRKAYAADITFGTNNEFGFDYLRDNMSISPEDLVQRKHHYAIVDEVDSVLIDDARTPLIISGPVPQASTDELFMEYRPRVEKLVAAQRKLVTQILADAKRLLNKPDATKKELEEGALLLLRAHKGLPKNSAIIKFLSEEGIKSQMTKAENFYMQDNNKNMHIVTDPLYFVIEEQHNSIELTDKGLDLISGDVEDAEFFVMPDMGGEMAQVENDTSLSDDERMAKKDEILQNYSVKTERVHT
ncbi:MAG TPA: hypothetical protein VJ909_01890, partial [Prolixibacteraceae bacterium]|nr:hypothetical protein [Prolixibacteraceae bacterium]